MLTLAPVVTAVLALASVVAGRDLCSTDASRWDYWWYGSGGLYHCPGPDPCHITKVDSKTIGWSVTTGGSLSFNLAKAGAIGFQSSYTWTESTTSGTSFTADFRNPEVMRYWIKQWFVVLDMTCQNCDWVCTPIGQVADDGGNSTALENRGQHCEQACDDKRHVTAWVPCKDDSCQEYQFSDAYAECDHANHCQQN